MAPAFGDLEFELSRLARRSRSNQARIAAEVHPDLDVSGYVVLVTVRDQYQAGTAVRASDIGEILGLHKSTMSRNLAALESLGLVERTPDPEDARARGVRLTEAGEQALTRTLEGRRALLRERLSDWPDGDIGGLAGLLRRYNDSF